MTSDEKAAVLADALADQCWAGLERHLGGITRIADGLQGAVGRDVLIVRQCLLVVAGDLHRRRAARDAEPLTE